MWHPALRAAGLDPSDKDRTGLHQLRHYAASVWIAGRATELEVARWLGHKSTATLKIYAHLFRGAADKGRTIMEQAFSARAYRTRTREAQ